MLLELGIAIIFAKILNVLFEKMKQPGVIGEILAGVLLGPSIIGSLSGSSINLFGISLIQFKLNLASPEFKEVAFIGVVFLLFIVGLETKVEDLKKTKKAGIFAGIFGVIIPFFVGCGVGLLYHMNVIQCMALGTILLATSATIAIRLLADMDMLATRVGLTLHTAVILNDIFAMIIFALVFGNGDSYGLLLQIFIFFTLTIGVGLLITRHYRKKNITRKAPVVIITTGLVICLLFAAFAEKMGITAIIGAFIAGLFFRKTPQVNILIDYIKTIGYAFFIPLFFVWIGASFDFLYLIQTSQLESLVIFIVIFVLAGIIGNFLGGTVGARLSGLNKRESVSVGIGMMPVMGVALIIVTTGIDKGIFGAANSVLVNQIKIATLILIITSSLITPFLLKRSMRSALLQQIGKTKTKLSFYHHPHCPECYSALRLTSGKNEWFCDICKKNVTLPRKLPSFARYEMQGKSDKYMQYLIGAATIVICGLAIQNMEGATLIDKFSALLGIFIGTTIGFLTVKYLFIKKQGI